MTRTKKAVQKGVGKRKRDDNVAGGDTQPPSKRINTLNPPQRPKQSDCDETIAAMDPSLLADHFAKAIRKHFPNNSSLEHEDLYLPTKAFRDTSNFDQTHVATNLPEFLTKFTRGGVEELSTCGKEDGPHTLVITSSGIRTADVARELRVFNKESSQVAKLIAKHMKLKDNIKYLQKTRVGIAISTPMRIRDLLKAGALKMDNVRRIVVDGSYQDEKKRSIFDLDELCLPLLDLLNQDEIKTRFSTKASVESPLEILVF